MADKKRYDAKNDWRGLLLLCVPSARESPDKPIEDHDGNENGTNHRTVSERMRIFASRDGRLFCRFVCHDASRRLAACIVGPLGLSSPRFRLRTLAARCLRYYASLRLPSSVPAWFAFGSRPVPWVDALCCVSLPACAGIGSFTVRVERQTPGCC